jgi:hypothetical protein
MRGASASDEGIGELFVHSHFPFSGTCAVEMRNARLTVSQLLRYKRQPRLPAQNGEGGRTIGMGIQELEFHRKMFAAIDLKRQSPSTDTPTKASL